LVRVPLPSTEALFFLPAFTASASSAAPSSERILAGFEKLRSPYHGYRGKVASLLQGFAGEPSEEMRRQLAKILPPEVLKTLTIERARGSPKLREGKSGA